MNIFYLSSDPKACAEDHCDKHVVKMIIEYAQLLSTAHIILDGKESKQVKKRNRKENEKEKKKKRKRKGEQEHT